MVMIDTHTREPKQTVDDVVALIDEAKDAGMHPVGWDIGFFQARDLRDVIIHSADCPHPWRNDPTWHPVTHISGVNCVVSQLEDRVTLYARSANGEQTRIFERDRRASSI